MDVCQNCKVESFGENEIFCGWCGARLIDLQLNEPVVVAYWEDAEKALGVCRIRNSGSRPVSLSLAGYPSPGVTLAGDCGGELGPGETREIAVELEHEAADCAPYVEVQWGQGVPLRAEVRGAKLPYLYIDPDYELQIWEDSDAPTPLTIKVKAEAPLYVDQVVVRDPPAPCKIEVLSHEVTDGELKLLCHAQRLAKHARSRTGELHLVVRLAAGKPIRVQVPFRLVLPPKIEATSLDFDGLFPDRARRGRVQLRNTGGASLFVTQIGEGLQGSCFTVLTPLPDGGMEIKAGDVRIVEIEAKLRQGRAKADLIVRSPEVTVPPIHLTATVLAAPPLYKGAVGIDFGTTNSSIYLRDVGGTDRRVTLQPDILDEVDEDRYTIPSAVHWSHKPRLDDLRDCVVGREAQEKAMRHETAGRTITSCKRDLGKAIRYDVEGVFLRPSEVAARVIRYLLDRAEDQVQARIENAVVTCPAAFAVEQLRHLIRACHQAGLKNVSIMRVLPEPTGAAEDALLSGQLKATEEMEKPYFLIFDFGGGTLDVSVVHFGTEQKGNGNEQEFLRVATACGDSHLGGDDFTAALRSRLIRQASAELEIDFPDGDPEKAPAQWRAYASVNHPVLTWEAERVKRLLSDQESVKAYLDLESPRGKKHVNFEVKVGDYNKDIAGLVRRSVAVVSQALEEAGIGRSDVASVLMVGKTSKTPSVLAALAEFFGRTPILHQEPKLCVAHGAARVAESEANADLYYPLDRTRGWYGVLRSSVLRQGSEKLDVIIAAGKPLAEAKGKYRRTVRPGDVIHIVVLPGTTHLSSKLEDRLNVLRLLVDRNLVGREYELVLNLFLDSDHRLHYSASGALKEHLYNELEDAE